MKNAHVKYQAAQLRKGLEKDILSSYNQLRDFTEMYGSTDTIQEETLILGSSIFDALKEGDNYTIPEDRKKVFMQEATRILNTIVQQSSVNQLQKHQTQKLLRAHFINEKPNKVVFAGELLGKNYPHFNLENISLQLKLGEITGVIGENGNGKSTLLKIVAGELNPDVGKASYRMQDEPYKSWRQIKKDIGYVPQQIIPWKNTITIKQQLQFTAALKGIKKENNENATKFIITRLGLEKFAHDKWNSLSGGFQLRCELARQLIWNPKLLVLDEPLANLDIKAQNDLLNDLRNLTNSLKSPMAMIMSSQNIYDLENIADNVIFIRNGKDIYNGPVDRINEQVKCNCYIIDAECSLLELQHAFYDHSEEIMEIKDYYHNTLVFTKQTLPAEVFLSMLVKSGISISLFRDVSNSTRIFFENE